ncbi:hypothetical protein ABVL70_20565, partial [Klebsiella pneumoniae]
KIGPDPRNFNQRVSLGRNDLLIRTFPSLGKTYAMKLLPAVSAIKRINSNSGHRCDAPIAK